MDRQAAIFDFDSRFFGRDSSWRVQDPRLGMIGAIRDAKTIFDCLSKHQGEKDFRLADHFQHLDPGFVESAQDERVALLPQIHLAPTAQQHRFRGRDLYLLTWTKEAGMVDLLKDLVQRTLETSPKQRSTLPYQRGNPLESASVMELRTEDLNGLAGVDDLPLARFRRIRSLVSINDGQPAERPGPYDRVFVYTSDPVLALLLERYILENQDRFTAGRNALMLSLVARVKEEALLEAQRAAL